MALLSARDLNCRCLLLSYPQQLDNVTNNMSDAVIIASTAVPKWQNNIDHMNFELRHNINTSVSLANKERGIFVNHELSFGKKEEEIIKIVTPFM